MGVDAFTHAVVFGDSAYPSGRYTLSNGLEGLVQQHVVAGHVAVGEALEDLLRFTVYPSDALATALVTSCAQLAAPGADTGLLEFCMALDHELLATKPTDALRKGSTRVGRQTLTTYLDVHNHLGDVAKQQVLEEFLAAILGKQTPGNQAIVMGLIHAAAGLSPAEAVAVEMTATAIGWASAALRLRQCDHITAQVMVERVRPKIREWAGELDELAEEMVGVWDEGGVGYQRGEYPLLGGSSPGLDLASVAHAHAPARLFMN